MAGANPYKGDVGDILGDLFGDSARAQAGGRLPARKEEKGIPWEAKIIDGAYYVPLEQVAELLKQNDVLPKVRAGIERRVEKGPPETAKKFGNETAKDM
jgi:hypothetical protein